MRRPKHTAAAYSKLERKVGDFATAASAVVIRLDDERSHRHGRRRTHRRSRSARSPPPTPRRSSSARCPSEELFRAAGAAAGAQARPAADVRGSVEYKRAMAAEMTVRSLRSAVARALSFA